MAQIITLSDPRLREKSEKVNLGPKTQELINELKQTLSDKGNIKGVGLSAVQIGTPLKIFLAYSKKSKKFLTFINPEIVWYSKRVTCGIPESKNKLEGCLSVPNVWGKVKRSSLIKIKYQTESGNTQIRKFSGFTATVIQHEYDHLQGILFIDRAVKQGEKIYELVRDEEGKEYLKEIKI